MPQQQAIGSLIQAPGRSTTHAPTPTTHTPSRFRPPPTPCSAPPCPVPCVPGGPLAGPSAPPALRLPALPACSGPPRSPRSAAGCVPVPSSPARLPPSLPQINFLVPPAGLEPAPPAPEAGALSAELRGRLAGRGNAHPDPALPPPRAQL